MKNKKIYAIILFIMLHITAFSQSVSELDKCMSLQGTAKENCLLNLIEKLLTDKIKMQNDIKKITVDIEKQKNTINNLNISLALIHIDLEKLKIDTIMNEQLKQDSINFFLEKQKLLIAEQDTINKKFVSYTENLGMSKANIAYKNNAMTIITLAQSFSFVGETKKKKNVLLNENYKAKQIHKINCFIDINKLNRFDTIPPSIEIDLSMHKGATEITCEKIFIDLNMQSENKPFYFYDFKKFKENATYTFTIEVIDFPFFVPTTIYCEKTNSIVELNKVIYQNIRKTETYDFIKKK